MPTLEDMINPDVAAEPQPQTAQSNDKTKDDSKNNSNNNKNKKNKKQEDTEEKPKNEPEQTQKEETKEEKKEEVKEEKKEEVKEEVKEEKKEEVKEEKKEDGPKVEEEKKKEFPRQPREPEPKIPSDFSALITEMNDLKKAGNDLFKKNSYDEAIEKYKEAYEKLEKELPKINHERSYNPQSEELLTLNKQIMSNLSLCYTKTEKYQQSIELDLKIIANDPKYDKSYLRLFNNYMKLDQKQQAVYFGDLLIRNFDEETKEKYKDDIPKIQEAIKNLQGEYDAIRAKERKEMIKGIAKYAVPIIVLVAAVAVYFLVFKKKKVAA